MNSDIRMVAIAAQRKKAAFSLNPLDWMDRGRGTRMTKKDIEDINAVGAGTYPRHIYDPKQEKRIQQEKADRALQENANERDINSLATLGAAVAPSAGAATTFGYYSPLAAGIAAGVAAPVGIAAGFNVSHQLAGKHRQPVVVPYDPPANAPTRRPPAAPAPTTTPTPQAGKPALAEVHR